MRTTNDERGEKGREGKRGDSLDLLTGKNFLATPLQKNLSIQLVNQFIYFRPHGSIVNRGQTTKR